MIEKETLTHGQIHISKGAPSSVLIKDEIDCDMTFTFELLEDAEHDRSVTKYRVIDPSKGIISITNPNQGRLHPESIIEIGTYKKQYRLFLDYVLAAQESGKDIYDDRKLDYYFYISLIAKK